MRARAEKRELGAAMARASAAARRRWPGGSGTAARGGRGGGGGGRWRRRSSRRVWRTPWLGFSALERRRREVFRGRTGREKKGGKRRAEKKWRVNAAAAKPHVTTRV